MAFPVELLKEEEGHVHVDAWVQFLADIKRAKGPEAVMAYLAGRELNFELKKTLQPRKAVAERRYARPSQQMMQGSPPLSPQSPRRVPAGVDEADPAEEEPTSIVVAMRENPDLVKVVEVDANAPPRHLCAAHIAHCPPHRRCWWPTPRSGAT